MQNTDITSQLTTDTITPVIHNQVVAHNHVSIVNEMSAFSAHIVLEKKYKQYYIWTLVARLLLVSDNILVHTLANIYQ